MSITNESLFQAIHSWVAANYPGRTARRLVLRLDGEDPVSLPIPPAPPVSGGLTDAFEDRVLAALEAESPLIAKRLAPRIGYAYNSHLRTRLAEMVRAGLIEQTPDGYRLGESDSRSSVE